MLKLQEDRKNFEKDIYKYLELTKNIIYRENDIIQLFGKNNSVIDNIILTNKFNLCFHNKWISAKPSLCSINNFIQCVNNISKSTFKKCYGIFISNLPLTDEALKAFKDENNNFFILIQDYDQNIIFKNLLEFLYSIEIFIYDEDNSCIMLEF